MIFYQDWSIEIMEKNRLAVSCEGIHSYDIILEQGFEQLIDELEQFEPKTRKLCIVTDSNVGSIYSKTLVQQLNQVFKTVEVFTFPAGEENKNLDIVQKLYGFLIEHNFDRKDILAALGGGVVGDLTGFAAATYLRGIRFIQIPTSLLAMSDSSIGGKTGVDFDRYKNMVGAFYMPKLVYMNVSVLSTLDTRQFNSGFGEVIKHGFIRDVSFCYWLLEQQEGLKARKPDLLLPMIRRNCEIKREIVEADPTEQGERALLNFGHTLGHAIEKLLKFDWLHGECVGTGMIASAYISFTRGYLSKNDLLSMVSLLELYSLPVSLSGLTAKEILTAASKDKKKEGSVLKFILLDKIGHAVIDCTVSNAEMTAAIEFLLGERTL